MSHNNIIPILCYICFVTVLLNISCQIQILDTILEPLSGMTKCLTLQNVCTRLLNKTIL